jgi:hypothetical protein
MTIRGLPDVPDGLVVCIRRMIRSPPCKPLRLVPQCLSADFSAASPRRFVLRAFFTRMGYKVRLTRLETP